MKKISFCLLLLFFSAFLHSQEVIIHGADGHAVFKFQMNTSDPDIRNLPRNITSVRQSNPAEFIRLLANYINEKSSSDFERVKKAHDWVALNIRYDTQSFFSGRYSSQSFNDVIRRGSAVCAGYSDVFKYLCDALEIECITVSGFAIGYGSSLFVIEAMSENHAWNIVTIEGRQYLIDTTWDSGHLNGRNFQAEYITDYLFTDPYAFIHRHFPFNSAYQLLPVPVSMQEFNNLPFLRPAFFNILESWPSLPRITELKQGETPEYTFTVIPGYELIYGWYTHTGTKIGNDVFPGRRESYTITVPSTLRAGKYILRLWVQRSGIRGYTSLGEFGFDIK